MSCVERTIQVSYRHQVHFTDDVFDPANIVLRDILSQNKSRERHKVLVVLDEALAQTQPFLSRQIETYFARNRSRSGGSERVGSERGLRRERQGLCAVRGFCSAKECHAERCWPGRTHRR